MMSYTSTELRDGLDIPDDIEAILCLDEHRTIVLVMDNETGELLSTHRLH